MKPTAGKMTERHPISVEKQNSGQKLYQKIETRNFLFTGTATPAQYDKTQKRNIFPPGQAPSAGTALAPDGHFHVVVLAPDQAIDKTADAQAGNKNNRVF